MISRGSRASTGPSRKVVQGSNQSYTLAVRVPKRHVDEFSQVLHLAGAKGLWEESARRGVWLKAFAPSRREVLRWRRVVEQVALEFGLELELQIKPSDTQWQTTWRSSLKPEKLTKKLQIQPVGDSTPIPLGVRSIRFEPALAFGDGAHATTRLAAQALEHFCSAHPGCCVLDFGSGTGVLAFVAVLSGARSALGVDNDPVAVVAAQHNAELNGLHTHTQFGSVDLVTHTRWDLVVANLEPQILQAVFPLLIQCAKCSHRLLVTGFLAEQIPQVKQVAQKSGWRTMAQQLEGEWALLELAPKARR